MKYYGMHKDDRRDLRKVGLTRKEISVIAKEQHEKFIERMICLEENSDSEVAKRLIQQVCRIGY